LGIFVSLTCLAGLRQVKSGSEAVLIVVLVAPVVKLISWLQNCFIISGQSQSMKDHPCH